MISLIFHKVNKYDTPDYTEYSLGRYDMLYIFHISIIPLVEFEAQMVFSIHQF